MLIGIIAFQRIADEHHRISPDLTGAAQKSLHREIIRNGAVMFQLIVMQMKEEALIESTAVRVEACGRCKHLSIPCPAKPLITLRTVGGNLDEVIHL